MVVPAALVIILGFGWLGFRLLFFTKELIGYRKDIKALDKKIEGFAVKLADMYLILDENDNQKIMGRR